MRILLVTSMVPDPNGIGAMPKLFAAELQGLRERHEVTLVSTFGEDRGQAEAAERLLTSDLDAHIVDRRRSLSAQQRWRVRAELAATWAASGRPWRVVSGAGGVQPLIDRLAKTQDFDIVAVEDNPMAVLRYPRGVPVVLTEHEAIRAQARQWQQAAPLRDRPLRALRALDWRRWDSFLPKAWNRSTLLQVFCSGDAAEIRRRDPALAARIRVNPYGMILPPASDPTRERPGTVLFTGTFGHLPNREAARWLALEIMPSVRSRIPEARLRLVGSAPPAEVRELAGTATEVIADAPDMEPHLEEASVVVAPVRSGGGMRIKVLEAMARSKAVVTTSLGAEGFTSIDPAPPLSVADDANAIAGAIVALLRGDERRELGERARAFAELHHSPTAWAARLESVYEEARSVAEEIPPTARIA